jgi:hypothetical protein
MHKRVQRLRCSLSLPTRLPPAASVASKANKVPSRQRLGRFQGLGHKSHGRYDLRGIIGANGSYDKSLDQHLVARSPTFCRGSMATSGCSCSAVFPRCSTSAQYLSIANWLSRMLSLARSAQRPHIPPAYREDDASEKPAPPRRHSAAARRGT